ncbi:MAG TPA: asparagine synthase-related protein, partial [Terriglobales bacterium]|nr:asparagine synthase-related protein [Terriglobales bacterium]
MSGVFGILRRDQRAAVPAVALAAARAAMTSLGPAAGDVWSDDVGGVGQLQRHDTPEAVHEVMPLVDDEVAFTAAARLDGRESLCDALAIPFAERSRTADGRLVFLAYRRWGRDCVRHLAGDWALAAWERKRRRLLLARDAFGQTGLYYHASLSCFAFATTLRGLFAMPGIPRELDELGLAIHLAPLVDDGGPTMWRQVCRLPPGHLLVHDDNGTAVERYWRPEAIAELRLGSDADYVEAFLAAYQLAVRERLRTSAPIAISLSGGLDSASMAALAASALAAEGRSLVALTMVPGDGVACDLMAGAFRFANEWQHAHRVAEQAAIGEHLAVFARGVTPLGGLLRGRAINPHEPLWSSPTAYWMVSLLEAARQRGIGVLLTGTQGNAVSSWQGGSGGVWTPLLAGRYRAAWRTLLDAGRAHEVSLARAVIRTVIKPLQRRFSAAASFGGFPIEPRFVERLDLRRRLRDAAARRAAAVFDPRAERCHLLMPGANNSGAMWQLWGAELDLDLRHPAMDQRLIELCFAIPEEQYASAAGDRWLLRRAMEGWLPREVQWERRRGMLHADLGHRLVASAAEIDEALVHV